MQDVAKDLARPPSLVQPSTDTIGMLRDLVDALDRRVPNAERVGEGQIAIEAAALKRAALRRIEELTTGACGREPSRTMRHTAQPNVKM
jgi:hypothetical protein